MAQKPESKLKSRAMPLLKSVPGSHWFRVEQQSTGGTPDVLGVIRGIFVAIEFKATAKQKVTPLQQFNLDGVLSCGGIALVVHKDNFAEILAGLEHFAETGELQVFEKGDLLFN